MRPPALSLTLHPLTPAARADPNIYPSGKARGSHTGERSHCVHLSHGTKLTSASVAVQQVCLSILNNEKGWKPSITVKQILLGIQELLDAPNNGDAAQEPAWRLWKDPARYVARVKEEVRKYPPAGDVVL